MRPLEAKHIEKTLLGVVQNWTDLFLEHRYAKTDRSGTPWVTRHPSTFNFLASEDARVRMFGPTNSWLTLYVKANPKMEEIVDRRMTPPIGGGPRGRNDIQSYQIIPWLDYGMALVTANDWNCIACPWVCFIPLEAVPEINPDNTAMFGPDDWPKINLTNTEIYKP